MTERADQLLGADARAELRRTLASQRWTAHNVKLLDGIETIPGTPEFLTTDTRLSAVRRTLRMRFGEDFTNLRIADLGSLEGGFAVAMALEGATVVGVEARPANVEKGELLRRHFGLSNLSFEQADVKDFTVERFGQFDVVLALGIAYHLDRPAAWLRQIAHATASVLVVDSHVAPCADEQLASMRSDIADLSPIELELSGDETYPGRWYAEFDEGLSDSARADQLWASWSNHRSFWLTEESLLRVLQNAGFDMVVQQHDATLHAYDYYRTEFSRGMYIALRTMPLERARTSGDQDAAMPSSPVPHGSAGSSGRLDAIEIMLDRHERAIERSKRTVASLRRQMSVRDLPQARPSELAATEPVAEPLLRAVEIERDGLMEIIRLFRRDSLALLGSRRWRVGNIIGRIFTPGIKRRRDELASTRLLRLTEQLEALRLISFALVPAPEPEPTTDANDDTKVNGHASAPWLLPVQRGYDVIVLANVCWRTRQQRPHHLARTFAAHGHRVFYVSINGGRLGHEDVVEERVIEVEFEPTGRHDRYDNVPDGNVVDEWMVAMESLRLRHGIDDAVVHVQLQSWTPLAWELRDAHGWRVVYDCMDEWTDFPGMGQALLNAELELVEGADLVVTTAEALRQKWAPHNANTLLVRNGVDADFFSDHCMPSDLLADVGHPIIGFTGAIAPWVDLALVVEVARARRDWTFVLVGDVYVDVDDLFGLDHMSNVIMTGLQPYTSMPRYLFWFDVAIIPFVVDLISAAVDPVKFYEYAASGTPIVTSPLPEIEEHRHLVYQGADATAFELAIEAALDEHPDLRRERIALAHSNTWINRYVEFDRATRELWPPLSVIIVTYGQLALTRRCLETLITNTSYPRLEVIVVDNGSTDGTPMFLREVAEQDQRITAILNHDNRGFAAANNQGLDAATGEVMILLNNDTEVSPGWHVPLLRHLDDPTIGLVGPRSDNVGNVARIDVPECYVDNFDGFTRLLQRDHDGELFEIGMLGMFCVAMRRDVYSTVGPLDEAYGIGLFEDDDYAERVRDAGWRVVCARDAFVHHVGQATFKPLIESGEYHEIWSINRARFESRWGPWRGQQNGAQPGTVG